MTNFLLIATSRFEKQEQTNKTLLILEGIPRVSMVPVNPTYCRRRHRIDVQCMGPHVIRLNNKEVT